MSEDKQSPEQVSQVSNESKIDAIKQLIFGENIQAYDSEFVKVRKELDVERKNLHDEINALRKESEQLIGDLKSDFEKTVEALKSQTQRDLEKLKDSKTDRVVLGNLLEGIAKKLKD